MSRAHEHMNNEDGHDFKTIEVFSNKASAFLIRTAVTWSPLPNALALRVWAGRQLCYRSQLWCR